MPKALKLTATSVPRGVVLTLAALSLRIPVRLGAGNSGGVVQRLIHRWRDSPTQGELCLPVCGEISERPRKRLTINGRGIVAVFVMCSRRLARYR